MCEGGEDMNSCDSGKGEEWESLSYVNLSSWSDHLDLV